MTEAAGELVFESSGATALDSWRRVNPDGTRSTASKLEPMSIKEAIQRVAHQAGMGGPFIAVRITMVPQSSVPGVALVAHCEHGPAVVTDTGTEIWCDHGFIHREGDLPAIIKHDGTQIWFRRGDRHRESNLPAYVAEEQSLWYRHGRQHRASGPARIHRGLPLEWLLHDVRFDRPMNKLMAELARGERIPVVQSMEAPAESSIPRKSPLPSSRGTYRLVSPDGKAMSRLREIPSVHWLEWIVANANEYVPELAAALRARAMREAMNSTSPGPAVKPRQRRPSLV